MKFITAEQFSKADKKVRDSIMAWWEPSIGDLTESKIGCEVWCLIDKMQLDRILNLKDSIVIPLLTVGQLIEFIEWKLDMAIDILKSQGKGCEISTKIMYNEYCAYEYDSIENDLLKALWEVAQNVCE